MTIYIVVFIISSFLLWRVENKSKSSTKYKIYVFVGLLLPILLAGLRKKGVGTDTSLYVWLLYNAARNSSNIFSYFHSKVYLVYKYVPVTNWEIGYITLVYFATKIFISFQGVLLVTHSIVIVLIYKGLVFFKGKIKVWFGMLIFYCMFYNHSLNIMRQWISMAILFYGFSFLIEKQQIKYFILILIASMFHTSGIMGIAIYLIYTYVRPKKYEVMRINHRKINLAIYKNLIILFGGISIMAGFNIFRNIISLLGNDMARYVKVYLTGQMAFLPNQLIRRMPIIILIIYSWNGLSKNTNLTSFYLASIIIECLLSQLNSIFNQSSRIAYYFTIYDMLLFPTLVQVQVKLTNKRIIRFLLLAYLSMYWYYEFVYNGWGETIPYKFFWN